MIRDTRADRAYFDRYIGESEAHIAQMEAKLIAPASEREGMGLRRGIASDRLNVIRARYSRGDDLEEIRPAALEAIISQIDFLRKTGYGGSIELASMAVLFGVDAHCADAIAGAMGAAGNLDRVTAAILASVGSEVESPWHNLVWPRGFTELADALEAGPGPEAIGLIKSYLVVWYRRNQGAGWAGSHRDLPRMLYAGYWSWEAAAVARGLGLAGEPSLVQSVNYPADLAVFLSIDR